MNRFPKFLVHKILEKSM